MAKVPIVKVKKTKTLRKTKDANEKKKDASVQSDLSDKNVTSSVEEEIAVDDPTPNDTSSPNDNDNQTQQAASCKMEIEDDQEAETKPKKRQKLIAFIGNLPYGCTEERLRTLLNMDESIIEIRLPRSPTNKARTQGYAFCEFNDPLAFRKCMLLHHSKFEGRRINVELTAGGGGNSQNRKKKIAMKNNRADKWRAKRTQKKEQELKQGGGKLPKKTGAKSAAS